MPDEKEANEWDAACAALAASGYPYPKLKRGPSTEAQRAAMIKAMQKINGFLFVAQDNLSDDRFGACAEDGVYADPQRELEALREARFVLDHAIETMEATDWCLEPAEQAKPR